jgi:hypothetical protein
VAVQLALGVGRGLLKVVGDLLIAGLRRFVAGIRMYGGHYASFLAHSCFADLIK